jgi:hypothetical protein
MHVSVVIRHGLFFWSGAIPKPSFDFHDAGLIERLQDIYFEECVWFFFFSLLTFRYAALTGMSVK